MTACGTFNTILYIHHISLDGFSKTGDLGHNSHGCSTSQDKEQLEKGVEFYDGVAEEGDHVEDGVLHGLVPTDRVTVIQQHLFSFNDTY